LLAAHRSNNACLGLVFLSPTLPLFSLPFLLAAVIPSAKTRRIVLLGALMILLVAVVAGSLALSSALAIGRVGLLLLLPRRESSGAFVQQCPTNEYNSADNVGSRAYMKAQAAGVRTKNMRSVSKPLPCQDSYCFHG
jgi:hypothetical protein